MGVVGRVCWVREGMRWVGGFSGNLSESKADIDILCCSFGACFFAFRFHASGFFKISKIVRPGDFVLFVSLF
jgi:hypothetical protein